MGALHAARSLNSLLVVLIVAGLTTVAAVILSMMTAQLSRNTDELLGAQLNTACKALVATMEQRFASVLYAHNSTKNTLRMDPAFSDAKPMAELGADSARSMILGPMQNSLAKMLDTVLSATNFWNILIYHPNGRITGFDSAFGRATGLWNYIESSDLYFHAYPMGVPSSDEAQALFGVPWQGWPPYAPSLGYLDTSQVMSDFRALDPSKDWDLYEASTGLSLGRIQLMYDGTLIDYGPLTGNATCYSIPPTVWNIFWTRAIAEGIGCQVAFEGVWAYNETGALELRDTLTGATIGKNGTLLAGGTYNSTADRGAWVFTHQYGSKKFNAYGFHFLPYVGRTRPYFIDKADGGLLDQSVDGEYGWYGPYAVPLTTRLIISAATAVHSRVDTNGTLLPNGQTKFAGVLLSDTPLEDVSLALTDYIDQLDVPEESRAKTVIFVVTSDEPRTMVAASNVAGRSLADVADEIDVTTGTGDNQEVAGDETVYRCPTPQLCEAAPMAESGNKLIAEAATDVTRHRFTFDGDVYLMRTADLNSLKLRWLVGIIVPEDPYTAGPRKSTQDAILLAVLIAFGVLVLWSALQHVLVARPLSQVSRGIKALGDMQLDEAARHVRRTSSGITTIDSLLHGFHEARRHLLAWRTQETQRRVALEKEKAARNLASVVEAQANASQLMHPMVLVPASTFLSLGQLTPYETLRLQAKLTFLDTLEQLVKFKQEKKVLFLSHQWLGWGAPDPNGVHYAAMSRATREAVAMLLPGMSSSEAYERTYVWVDFGSIAQEHRGMQVMAISSLPVYAAYSDAFIVVAPKAEHAQTKLPCDLGTYSTRGWCRAEMLSKVCGSGLEHMYVYNDDEGAAATGGDGGAGGKLEPVTMQHLKRLSLHVFEGQFSCCALKHANCTRCDKQELALPVLGLYSLVLTRRSQPHMAEIASLIENDKSTFFPSHIDYIYGKDGEKSETRPLMDGLVEVMEEYVAPKKQPICLPTVQAGDDEKPPSVNGASVTKAGAVVKGKKSRVYAVDIDRGD